MRVVRGAAVATECPPDAVEVACATLATAEGRLLSASMYSSENGNHAATNAAIVRLNTVRYRDADRRAGRAGGFGRTCSVIALVIG